MRRQLALPVAALLVGAALAGCGSDKPAVCSSVDELKSSVGNLKDMSLSANGISEIQGQLATIKGDFQQVKQDAKGQYAAQLDTVDGDVATLRSSVTAAKDATNVTTLGAVGAAVRALSTDVKTLVDDIANTC